MKTIFIFFLCLADTVAAQTINNADSVKMLENVIVRAYEQNRKLIDVAAPVSVTGQAQLNRLAV